MLLRTLLLVLLLSPSIAFSQQSELAPADTLLVCAPDLLNAAKPWIEHRTEQGHQIAVLSGAATEARIKQEVVQRSRFGLKSVVIMGDAPSGRRKQPTDVETHQMKSTVIQKWGAEPTFTTDNFYADIDDNGTPNLTIGRISVDSAAQLAGVVDKIIAYERGNDFGTWRRKVNFVAGIGGFGVLADRILETTARKFITDGIPAEYTTSMTQASWRSVYSPDPRRFQEETINRLNEGSLAWIYLGHGRKRSLDWYRTPNGGLPILSTNELANVATKNGSPIAVFLSCYTGAFDIEPDCMAEQLLESRGGPVAVIAATNITMPYAMTVMGNAMLHELFVEKRETLGEVVMYAKRELAKPTGDQPKTMVDQLAKVISPDPDLLDEERAEHVQLFHLFGDPLLRIRYPKEVTVEAPEYGTAGDTVTVTGRSAVNGQCRIELVCRRDRLTFRPQSRREFQPKHEWLNGLQQTYEQANDPVWTSTRQPLVDGSFQVELKIPEGAMGPSHVRVFVESENDFAMGAADIYLRPPPEPEVAANPADATDTK